MNNKKTTKEDIFGDLIEGEEFNRTNYSIEENIEFCQSSTRDENELFGSLLNIYEKTREDETKKQKEKITIRIPTAKTKKKAKPKIVKKIVEKTSPITLKKVKSKNSLSDCSIHGCITESEEDYDEYYDEIEKYERKYNLDY